jgi:hypothetical protein
MDSAGIAFRIGNVYAEPRSPFDEHGDKLDSLERTLLQVVYKTSLGRIGSENNQFDLYAVVRRQEAINYTGDVRCFAAGVSADDSRAKLDAGADRYPAARGLGVAFIRIAPDVTNDIGAGCRFQYRYPAHWHQLARSESAAFKT